MTAHDPRVTLTEAEIGRLRIGVDRDETGEGDNTTEHLIAEVESILAARLAPIRALAEDYDGWEIDEIDVPWIALADLRAALDAPVSASQDHDWHQPLTHCHCGRVIPCRHHDGAEGQRTRLGRRLETILAQRWPDSGVNPWLLADLLAEEQGEGEKAGEGDARKWMAFPGKVPVCQDCGADWKPVQRGQCLHCGSDLGPLKPREENR